MNFKELWIKGVPENKTLPKGGREKCSHSYCIKHVIFMRVLEGSWQFIHITNWGYYTTTQLQRKDLIKDPITQGKKEKAEQ